MVLDTLKTWMITFKSYLISTLSFGYGHITDFAINIDLTFDIFRTFKEFEVRNQKLREDLYEKMVKLDPSEPTEQENIDKAVTKLRYMTVSVYFLSFINFVKMFINKLKQCRFIDECA